MIRDRGCSVGNRSWRRGECVAGLEAGGDGSEEGSSNDESTGYRAVKFSITFSMNTYIEQYLSVQYS